MDSLSACILAVFFFFYICFLCICAPVVYQLVVKAASIDRYSYLSGSLPLLFFFECLFTEFTEAINVAQH